MPLTIFVDSDVVISSLMSSKGAAFLLLNQKDGLELFVSNISIRELEEVSKRLNINLSLLNKLINKQFKIVQLGTIDKIKTDFLKYVFDIDDAHIVAGAKEANARFLISYNTRHFKADKLKDDFKIILTTPANLLQFLRSV